MQQITTKLRNKQKSNKPNLAGDTTVDFETEDEDVFVVTESELVVADCVSFLGFGAGGGGRLFTAVDETAHHVTDHSLLISNH